jgi:hypothetical protein
MHLINASVNKIKIISPGVFIRKTRSVGSSFFPWVAGIFYMTLLLGFNVLFVSTKEKPSEINDFRGFVVAGVVSAAHQAFSSRLYS